jgi:lysophospholipase L1-like esterase
MEMWREDLDPKIAVVHEMSHRFGATLVPFDQMFTDLAEETPMSQLAEDGIHPTDFGHQQMASLWLDSVGF